MYKKIKTKRLVLGVIGIVCLVLFITGLLSGFLHSNPSFNSGVYETSINPDIIDATSLALIFAPLIPLVLMLFNANTFKPHIIVAFVFMLKMIVSGLFVNEVKPGTATLEFDILVLLFGACYFIVLMDTFLVWELRIVRITEKKKAQAISAEK